MNDYGDIDAHDNEFSYLNDFALLHNEPSSTWISASSSRKGKVPQDELFIERLESFIEGQMKDIKSFATREGKSFDEIRKLVAIPHARYLFSLDLSLPTTENRDLTAEPNDTVPSIKTTLAKISRALQLLHNTTDYDSVLLVVSPHTPPSSSSPAECSWIGGTDLGKEFWMGLKGGGISGARAFRIKSHMRYEADHRQHKGGQEQDTQTERAQPEDASSNHTSSTSNQGAIGGPLLRGEKLKGVDIKNELYAAMRQALRTTSGNPSAEMRWTKPASLEELYNVRLYGWPPSIHLRNPSNNTVNDNRKLLMLVQSGEMKFVKREDPEWTIISENEELASRSKLLSPTPEESRAVNNPDFTPTNMTADCNRPDIPQNLTHSIVDLRANTTATSATTAPEDSRQPEALNLQKRRRSPTSEQRIDEEYEKELELEDKDKNGQDDYVPSPKRRRV